jgi:hypothetical protein
MRMFALVKKVIFCRLLASFDLRALGPETLGDITKGSGADACLWAYHFEIGKIWGVDNTSSAPRECSSGSTSDCRRMLAVV